MYVVHPRGVRRHQSGYSLHVVVHGGAVQLFEIPGDHGSFRTDSEGGIEVLYQEYEYGEAAGAWQP